MISKPKIDKSKLNFPNRRKSTLEIKIEKFLNDNNINFISQKTFNDLGRLRFDFYLPEYNLILEPGGEHHLIPIEKWGGEKELTNIIERDKKKYEYCEQNNIKILYYFSFKKENRDLSLKTLSENGYHGEWFIDFNEFLNRILEIIKNGKS